MHQSDARCLVGTEALAGERIASRLSQAQALTICVEIGVGAMPCRTSLIANSAPGVASAKSTQHAIPTPPPKQPPWMTAMVGFGSSWSVLLNRTVTIEAR